MLTAVIHSQMTLYWPWSANENHYFVWS